VIAKNFTWTRDVERTASPVHILCKRTVDLRIEEAKKSEVPQNNNHESADKDSSDHMKQTAFRTKSLFSLLASLFAVSASFAATTIGVNFQGRDGVTTGNPGTPPLAPTEVAGVVPQGNWNNVDDQYGFTPANDGNTGPLVDSTGAATTVTLTFAANDSWYNDVDPALITTPNARLMNGIIKEAGVGNSAAFKFEGLPNGKYDLYVYFDMNGDTVSLDLSDGNSLKTFYVTETHHFRDTNTFIQCLNTNPAGPRDVGNYVKFSALDTYGRSSLAVLGKYVANADGIGIAGLQLVNVGPSTANTNPVSITQQAASRRVIVGDANVSFSIFTKGPVFSVQWYKNGAPILGATNYPVAGISGVAATYLAPPITAGDNGATFYAVISNNVNSVQSSNAVITIGKMVSVPGAKEELWYGALRADVEAGTQDSIPPDRLLSLSKFEVPDEQGDNFAERVSALFKAPVTGDYVFFIASDDDSDLFLSTDSSPLNKQMIAQEVDWCGDRNWTGNDGGTGNFELPQKRSDRWVPDTTMPPASPPFANGIHLTNGITYYIEAVHHEGGGGDNLAVTFKLKGDPDPAPGAAVAIAGFVLAPYVQGLDGASITVTNFPQNFTGAQSRTATLTIGATSGYIGDTSAASPGLAYQWQSAASGSSTFTNITAAAGASFTTPILKLSDSGAQFRVALLAGDTNITSSVATLTVTPDTTPPRPAQVTSVKAGFKVVTLTFDELMDKTSAETGANYVFSPGNVAGASGSLAADDTTVTVTTGTALTPNVTNVLTITGVKDLAGNAVAPSTTISFIFQPVTYEADILFDGPLAFYRFEDAVGSAVVKNTGSTGGDGGYYTGNESAPGAGDGVPSTAKGDAGPRPPTFVGFEASNHAAVFDGVGEWVDTKNQFLQNRSAFTLEYWVAPADRANQGTRIGIVGQNDAIEYGFIDPNTIQIWTPNGGSLNTAYTNADNEWHHVATIASGTDLRTYYDGVLVGTGGNATGNYGSSLYNVHIGGGGVFDGTGNWFNGHIDEVAVFDKAIPADRVAEHYNAGKNGGVLLTSGAVTPPLTSNITLAATRSGNTLTISWSPSGGTLQSATVLPAPAGLWTDVGTANPATITIGSGNSFYRVKQ